MAKHGYILIPDDVMARTDLTLAHKAVMGVLARLQGDQPSSFPSLSYIGKACGISRSQVIRVVNDLVERKEIIRLHHPHLTNTYSVPWATARALRKKWAIAKKAS
jgi:DNA-binding MarR family transcriptional regulator